MILIGDVHGGGKVAFEQDGRRVGMLSAERKKDVYFNMVRGLRQPTIQIGDLGFLEEHEWFLRNVDCNRNKVLFGNHDYMPMVHEKHSMGDFQFISELRLMTIRGARSIDQHSRTEGLDWFREEELSMEQCEAVLAMVDECRPKIIVSHDCPTEVCMQITGRNLKSRTDQLLQACFIRHQPDLWVYGHHHFHHEMQLNRTKFVCLGELELLEI